MSGSSPDPYRYGHPPPSHTDDHIHPYTHRHNHYHHNFSPLALQEFAGFAPIQDDPLLYQDFNNAVDDSFNAAFVSSHTLPSLDYNFGFLDNMPGPAESDSLPFGYITHEGPSRERARSPIVSIPINAMSSSRHTYERRPRLPNGFDNLVDLTSDPQEELPPISRPKRQSPTPGPSQKRLKHNDGTSISVPDREVDEKIEAIDLSGDQQAVQNVLQKQREDAIKSQQRPEEQATTFNTFTCVICMDLPTDLTATSCGHLFCHTCLMEALIAGENRSAPGEPKRSQCPVCRKVIKRGKNLEKNPDIIPLLLKKGLATQPRKKTAVAAAPKYQSKPVQRPATPAQARPTATKPTQETTERRRSTRRVSRQIVDWGEEI